MTYYDSIADFLRFCKENLILFQGAGPVRTGRKTVPTGRLHIACQLSEGSIRASVGETGISRPGGTARQPPHGGAEKA